MVIHMTWKLKCNGRCGRKQTVAKRLESRCVLMGQPIDLTGKRFGRLTVIQVTSKRSSQGDIYWKCICDCGKTVIVNGKSLEEAVDKNHVDVCSVNGQTVSITGEHMVELKNVYSEYGEE